MIGQIALGLAVAFLIYVGLWLVVIVGGLGYIAFQRWWEGK